MLERLSEVADIIMGQSPPSDYYNTSGDGLPFFQGKADFGDVYPRVRVYCSQPNKIAESGDILISVRAPVGPVNINRTRSCIGRGLSSIRVKPNLHPKYLYYFLILFEPSISGIGKGSTFEAIRREDLENILIPVRAFSEQHQIASLLDRVDRLRRSRRYSRHLTGSLLSSEFLKLFASEESRDWPVEPIEDLAKPSRGSIRTGPFGSQLLHSEFTDEGVAVLGIDNVVQNRFSWDERRYISDEKFSALRRYRVYPQDILITIMGTCGRCAVVPEDIPLAITTKHLCCITLDQTKCLPLYLQACFLNHTFVLRQLGVSERGAVMPGLNMGIIKETAIPLAPMPLQEKFVEIVRRFERLNRQQVEAERQAEHLFQALLHRAFSGQKSGSSLLHLRQADLVGQAD